MPTNINILKQLKSALTQEFLNKTELSLKDVEVAFEEAEKALTRKPYGLVWEEQQEDHINKTKDKVLYFEEDKNRAILKGDKNQPHHLLIEGDNYDALKLLQLTHKGQVDVIYIDPPYNRGKGDFAYNDSFIEKTDKWKHSCWLSFMYARLSLARELMAKTGVIFISIDEHEFAQLKLLCDQIFGENNFVGNSIRKTRSSSNDVENFYNEQHEYLLIYSKTDKFNFLGMSKDLTVYKNPDNDPKGNWKSGDPSAKSGGDSTFFEIINPYTKQIDLPPKGRYWAFSKSSFEKYVSNGKIVFKTKKKKGERGFIFKIYQNDLKSQKKPLDSLSFSSNEFLNQVATKEFNDFNLDGNFEYPKPSIFIKKLISYTTSNKEAIILDFFAGSGTTAHAVLELNQEDGGSRQVILCTNNEVSEEKQKEFFKLGKKGNLKKFKEEKKKEYEEGIKTPEFHALGICHSVTYPRLKKIIEGYTTPENKEIKGIPASLHYLTINENSTKEELFNTENRLPEDNSRVFLPLAQTLIQLRDNVWNEFEEFSNDKFRLFQENEKLIFLATSELTDFDINQIKNVYQKFEYEKGILYIFSIDSRKSIIYSELKKIGIESKPIPREFINRMEV